MQLVQIDKTRYRQRLNLVSVALIIILASLSVLFGAGLIALFGAPPAIEGESTGNFTLNLLGVVLAALVCAATLNHVRHNPFMREVYYVWQLKQLHNRIYRRLAKIKTAAAVDDTNALKILSFYYASLRQVYLLDDNTLTLATLDADMARTRQQLLGLGLEPDVDGINPEQLQAFR
jgi:hypothetical protein